METGRGGGAPLWASDIYLISGSDSQRLVSWAKRCKSFNMLHNVDRMVRCLGELYWPAATHDLGGQLASHIGPAGICIMCTIQHTYLNTDLDRYLIIARS